MITQGLRGQIKQTYWSQNSSFSEGQKSKAFFTLTAVADHSTVIQ